MGEAYTELQDTGDFLKVSEEERLDFDDCLDEESNEDEFADYSEVPDGQYVELSTASADEPVGWPEEEEI